jgi:hypothetical protein
MKSYELTGVNPIYPTPGRLITPGTREAERFDADIDPALEQFLIEIGAIREAAPQVLRPVRVSREREKEQE